MRESIRAQIGMSQEDLAVYLDISRELLAAYETDRRMLPSSVSTKLTELELIFFQHQNSSKLPEKENEGHRESMVEHLTEHIREHKIKAYRVEKKLAKMKKLFDQHIKRFYVMSTLLSKTDVKENDKAWLTAHQQLARAACRVNGEQKQTILQLRLDEHSRQIEQASALLERWNPTTNVEQL